MLVTVLSVLYLWMLQGVLSDPYFTHYPPTEQFALKGSNVKFDWNYNNDSSSLLFGKWGKGGVVFITKSPTHGIINNDPSKYTLLQTATLEILNVNLTSSGSYYCSLNFLTPSGTVKDLRHEAMLTAVNYAPNFTSPLPERKIGTEGSNELKLTVLVVGEKQPVVEWYRNGIVASNKTFDITNKMIGINSRNEIMIQSNLTIKSPNRTSNALFLAKASYGRYSPVSNTSTFVDVWYGPESVVIYSSKSGQGIGKNEQVAIQCSAVSHPISRFTIYRNETIVLNSSLTGEYTISAFSKNNSGNYTCVAQNEVGTVMVGSVIFTYNETKMTTPLSTTSTVATTAATSNTTTSKKVTTINPGQLKATSNAIPWWVWLVVAIAVIFLISIPVAVYCFCARRKKPKSNGTIKFSKHGDFLDNYIQQTTYSLGYENEVKQEAEPQSEPPQENEDVMNDSQPDVHLAMDNLGVRFESEQDLLEHYKMGRKDDDNADDDKDYDPFASDESDAAVETSSQKSFGDEHGIHYETDEVYKVNSEDEADTSREAVSYTAFQDDIIQYDI